MIAASEAWRNAQKGLLAPEGFVEISMLISEDGIHDDVTPSSESEATFSDIDSITNQYLASTSPRYATFEKNLWLLDGTRNILPDEAPYVSAGFVSGSIGTGFTATVEDSVLRVSNGSVTDGVLTLPSEFASVSDGVLTLTQKDPVILTLSLSEVHTHPLQGITITWSEEYAEWATKFTVTAYNGESVVAKKTVSGNTDVTSVVYMEIANYDRIVIAVNGWSIPGRRVRIERVFLGVSVTYKKTDLMSYRHTQSGCINSGQLPKNSIEFSLDNSDGRWNPNNPQNIEQYLSERQRVTVRYGFTVDGVTEWIKAGTFYLAEWYTPSNGLEATFVARDMLELMMETDYTGPRSGTLYEIAAAAVKQAGIPMASVYLDEVLQKYSVDFTEDDTAYTLAEIMQMCANASGCVLFQNNVGTLVMRPLVNEMTSYVIGNGISYTHPEFTLNKQLKAVEVGYGAEEPYTLDVGAVGETQTVSNPFITTSGQARTIAEWVANSLKNRQTISGEYRADPRLEVFDAITVDSKYGVRDAVVITDIEYSFTGAFRGIYTGRVVSFAELVASGVYAGEIYAGEM